LVAAMQSRHQVRRNRGKNLNLWLKITKEMTKVNENRLSARLKMRKTPLFRQRYR